MFRRLPAVPTAARAPQAIPTPYVTAQLVLVTLVALASLLALINLPYAPATWFDEGSHLHVPKTLVRYGVYADISSEGFRYFGPTIGVGPTVMLPVALAFQLFDVGLVQARLVIVGYLVVALGSLFLLARRLHGTTVALVAFAFLLGSRTLGYEGMIEYGRQVLGEVPGVAFLGLGLLAWVAALRDRARAPQLSLLAGLGFGLALVTKNQFVLIVPPTLALLALLDWRYYRAGGWWLRIAPVVVACACFGLWTLINLTFLGPAGFSANLAKTRQAAGGAIFVFELEATLRAVRYLAQVYGGLLIPGLAYALWRCRARTPQALAELAPSLMAALWVCWYLGSLGWPRYAFPAVALGALATARMLVDGLEFLWRRRPALAWLLGLYALAAICVPIALTARVVLSPRDDAQRMAAYLTTNVPQQVIVETWEPELGVLTDHTYHYPPTELLDGAVRHVWFGDEAVVYNGLAERPPFVVVGSFGAWVQIYPAELLASEYVQRYQAGPYVLFERVAP
jgi:4-amino-4-deoxy-L-arabinose transferase-like glycosyltransferase